MAVHDIIPSSNVNVKGNLLVEGDLRVSGGITLYRE